MYGAWIRLYSALPDSSDPKKHMGKYAGYQDLQMIGRAYEFDDEGNNLRSITFPQCVGGGDVVTHVGILLKDGDWEVLVEAVPLFSPISVMVGTTMKFGIQALTIDQEMWKLGEKCLNQKLTSTVVY